MVFLCARDYLQEKREGDDLHCVFQFIYACSGSWNSPHSSKIFLKRTPTSHRAMHVSLHEADDPDWLVDILALVRYAGLL